MVCSHIWTPEIDVPSSALKRRLPSLLGADKAALDIYVSFAAFQAVYVHANVGIPTGPLKYVLATPWKFERRTSAS